MFPGPRRKADGFMRQEAWICNFSIFFFWCYLFLPVGELGSAKVAAAKLDVENTLHVGKDLLVGSSSAALKLGHDRLDGVALGGKVLLGHLGLHLLTSLGDDVADLLANGVGLDDVVGSVDLGHALAFRGTTL